MSKNEDIEILESSLLSIKQIASLLEEIEQYYNNNEKSKEGLTKRQAQVLLYLLDLAHPPSIRELSRYLSTSHQNIKHICSNLEKEKLILFVSDMKDKRKKRIQLTFKGESKANDINKSLKRIARKISYDFSPNDIDEIARLLRKIQFIIDDENYEIRKQFNN